MKQPSLFDTPDGDSQPERPPDQAARDFAVDPANDVVLEASAGTGKTRVLVERYVRLILAGVDPRHILAITFTRKAAAEMRERVLTELRRRVEEGAITPKRWRELSERIGDIQISTIDAFCFGLLREFPLEADVDPAFDVADETEMARFANEALDLTLRAVRALIKDDEHIRLLLARVSTPILSGAIASLLDRRHVALPAIATVVKRDAHVGSAAETAAAFVRRIRDVIDGSPHRAALLDDGPAEAPGFRWLAADIRGFETFPSDDPARVQQLRRRIERYFLTKAGDPRKKISKPILAEHFATPAAKKRHEQAIEALAPMLLEQIEHLDRDVNALLARGLLRVLVIAVRKYEQLFEENALLDFAGMLDRAVTLLERQEEFARSRLKLQARYHHLLIDEFQDTSRLQWRLIELLVKAWGEGEGTADAPTSIFIVGDRKQSIYRFRHAEVTLLDEAARRIGALRPGRTVRQAITMSFRAVPELLAFVNALAHGTQSTEDLDERFHYGDSDRFPVAVVGEGALRDDEPVLGLVAQPSMAECAAAVADEIGGLIGNVQVRDRSTGARPARADEIAIRFRARAGHQYFEEALEARGVRTYVYKGLGFFDAPEVQDLQALLRFLSAPESDLRAAEFLRSRFVRISDVGLARLAPFFARALGYYGAAEASDTLGDLDRAVLARARESVGRWLALADRVPPSELVDQVLRESAYVFEMRGRRLSQARENVKKVRALIRRVENRGYTTLGRLAAYFDTLRAGDEANAIVEASGAVNLMTMHAAKGLEFPIVFLVNLHMAGRGRPAGFSVIERGANGEPEVAFNQTEGTRLEDRRESEELRRLLYVAVTRARDRLYLAAEVDQKNRLKRGARSLGALLPAGISDLFGTAAATDATTVTWGSDRGGFTFRVCRPLDHQAAETEIASTTTDLTPVAVPDALVPGGRRVVTATAQSSITPSSPVGRRRSTSSGDERLVGTLVHRLFQRSVNAEADDATLTEAAVRLLRGEECVDVPDVAALAASAATLYRAFRLRDDVKALLETGQCFYEVPFSYEPADRPSERVRGSVDCLVVSTDGATTILEFKTGAPRPEHEAQAAVYAEAMRAALGVAHVETRVLYA